MNYKNILLIGGTHGDERTGVDLVKYFEQNPSQHIETLIANINAVKQNIRFVETDMNRSVGKQTPISYEEILVKELELVIKKSKLIIEFHNTTASSNTCAIVTTEPNQLHYFLAHHFGLNKILIMPAQGSLSSLNSKKFFSLEISNDDIKFSNTQNLITKLKSLIKSTTLSNKKINIYKFTGITVVKPTLKRLKISLTGIENFQEFTKKTRALLQLPSTGKFCPIFIGEKAYGSEFGFYIAEIKQ